MNIVSKFVISCSLLVGLFFVVPANAQLQSGTGGDIGAQLEAAGGKKGAGLELESDPRRVVYRIINVALSLVGTILFVLIAYSGFLWMTAGGNEEQVAQAKTTIRNCVIGVIIVLMSWMITVAATRLASGRGLSGANNLDAFEQATKDCLTGGGCN